MKHAREQKPRQTWLKRFARGFTLLFAVQTALSAVPAYAQLAASPTADVGAKPIIDQARNGTGIVHIAPPNAGGISRNQYEQFNVGSNGLILNNSAQNTNTVLGGWIAGNPQLGAVTQPARIILNEVTSANPSALRGTIEVGGQRADIIVANPNGIQCDGCGFLNAGRAVLTTGSTQLNADGSVHGFSVERGSIGVGPAGLDARGLEQLDLLARGLVIEGAIAGDKINAIAGANRVLYGDVRAITNQAGTGQAPKFAIDIRDVGGMYANQVYMVATDKGVGVNSSGRLAALEGSLTLSADGDLRVGNAYGKQGVQLASAGGNAEVRGNVVSEADVRITSAREVRNEGTIQAAQRVRLDAPVIDNRGVIHQASTTEDLVLSPVERLSNRGQIYSAAGLRISAQTVTGEGDGKTSSISSEKDLSIQADTVALSGQTLSSNQSLHLSGNQVSITSSTVQAVGEVTAQASGTLDLSGSQISSNNRVNATGDSVRLVGTGVRSSGALLINGNKDIDAQSALLQAGTEAHLSAQHVSTRGATVVSEQVSVASTGSPLDNVGGQLVGTRTLSVSGIGIDNTGGALQSNGNLNLSVGGGVLSNNQGTISAATVTLSGVGQLSNRGGYLVTQSDLSLSGPLDNQGGTLGTAGSLTVLTGGGELNNQQGNIGAGRGVSIATSGGGLNNQGGAIHAGGALALDTGALDNTAGSIGAVSGATVRATTIHTAGGTVAAGAGLRIDADALEASQARIGAGSDLTLNIARDASLNGATLSAGSNLGLSAQTIQSQGTTATAGANLNLVGQSLTGGTWSAAGNSTVAMRGPLDISGGALLAGGQLAASGNGITTDGAKVVGSQVSLDAGEGELSNVGGQIVATGAQADALSIQARGVNNQSGSIASAGGAWIDARGAAFDNRGGSVEVIGDLALTNAQVLNQGGSMSTKSDLTLIGQAIDNRGGRLQTGGNLTIDTKGQRLDISQGVLLAEKEADIRAGELTASGATIAGGTGLTVRADQMNLNGARVISGGAADVQANGTLLAQGSQWAAEDALSISAKDIDATRANIVSNESVSLHADRKLNLDNALVAAQGPQSSEIRIQGGEVTANSLRATTDGQLVIRSAGNLAMNGAQLLVGKNTELEAVGQMGLKDATVQTAKELSINAASLTASVARLSAGGSLQATAAEGLLDLDRARVVAGGQMNLSGQSGIRASEAKISAVDDVRMVSSAGDFVAQGATVQSDAGGVTVQARSINLQAPLNATGQPTSGVLAVGDIELKASQDVLLGGTVIASEKAIGIQTQGAVSTAGATVVAGTDASLQGSTLNNEGGRIDATGALNIALSGDTLNNRRGRLSGQTSLSITSEAGSFTQFDNSAGSIQTQGALSLATTSLNNRAGQIVAEQSLTLQGGAIDSTDGMLASTGDVRIDTGGAAFTADRARVLSQGGRVDLVAGDLLLAKATVASGQAVEVHGSSVRANDLVMGAKLGDAVLDVGQGEADLQGATLQAAGDVRLIAGQTNLSQAGLSAGGAIDAQTSSLQADGSQWQAQKSLNVSASQGAIRASGAKWVAGENVGMQAANGIDISNGLVAGEQVALDAGTGLLNNQDGTLIASSAGTPGTASLVLRGQGLNNQAGRIESAGDLQAIAGTGALNNQQGSLLAAGAMALESQGLDNRQGTVASNGDLTIAARQGSADPLATQLDNTGGTLRSVQGALNVQAGNILNPGSANPGGSSSVIAAATDITLNASGRISNSANDIVAGNNLSVTAVGAVDNASGRLLAIGTASVQGSSINNAGGQIAANERADVTANSGGIDNTAGSLQAGGDLSVHSAGDLTSTGGQIHSGGELQLQAAAMSFTQGKLSAQDGASLVVSSFDGAGSQLSSGGVLNLQAGSGAVQLDQAQLSAVGTLDVQGGSTRMADAILQSGGSQTLVVQSLTAPRARLESGGVLEVRSTGAVDLNAGQLLATGDVRVQGTDLKLRQAQVATGRDARITGQNIDAHQIEISATRDAALVAAQALDFGGSTIAAGQDLRVGGTQNVVSGGASLQAARDIDVSVSGLLTLGQANFQYQAGRDLALSADSIDVAGQSLSARNLSVVARTGELNNEGGSLTAAGELIARGQGVRNTAGTLAANGVATVDAGSGTLDNRSGTIYSAESSVSVAGQHIDNRGGTLAAATNIGISGGSLDNRGTTIAANETLDIRLSGQLNNSSGGQLQAYGAGSSTVSAGQGIDNQGGQISTQQSLSVDAGTGNLVNSDGSIQSLAALSVAGWDIRNRNGSIIGRESLSAIASGTLDHAAGATMGSESGAVHITAGTLDNTGNTLQSATDLSISAGSIQNGSSGTLSATNQLAITLQGGTLDNRSGLIAGRDVSIQGQGGIQNQGSVISGLNSVNLAAGSVNNTSGVIESGIGGIRIDTGDGVLTNTASGTTRGIVSEGGIQITTGTLNNAGGYVGANGQLGIDASSGIDNRLGTLLGLAGGAISTGGTLDNTSGSITSAGNLSVNAAQLSNTGTSAIYAAGDLSVTATSIDNSGTHDGSYAYGLLAGGKLNANATSINNAGGAIVALGDVDIRASTELDNRNGKIAGDNVSVNTARLVNTGGRIDATKMLSLEAPDFSADGVVAGGAGLTLRTQGDYTNTGTVATNGNLNIETTGNYTNQGTVSATNHLDLRAANLDNQAGASIIAASTSIGVTGTVNNAGLINASSGATTIEAATVNNQVGGRIYGGSVSITAGEINNESTSVIASRSGDLTLTGAVNNEPDALLLSLNHLNVNGSLRNVGGKVNAWGNITVSGQVTNENAGLQTEQQSSTTALNKVFYAPSTSPGTRYAQEDIRFVYWGDPQAVVVPSQNYPFDRYGAEPYKPTYVVPCLDCDDTRTPYYADNHAVWATFNVAAPDFSDLTAPTMPLTGPGANGTCLGSDGERSGMGVCAAYWTTKDIYDAEVNRRRTAQLAQLQTELDAFNADLVSRRFEDYFVTTVTSQEVTKDVVIASKPGQIVAGGAVNFNGGGVNKDSWIIAGGQFVSDGALINQASTGQSTTVDLGNVYLSRQEHCGAFGTSVCRRNDAALPLPSIATSSEFNLDVRPVTPPANNGAPENQSAGAGAVTEGYAVSGVVGGTRPKPLPVSSSGTAAGSGPSGNASTGSGVSDNSQAGQGVNAPSVAGVSAPGTSGAVSGGGTGSTVSVNAGAGPQGPNVSLAGVQTGPAADQPLRGSVIADGVRAGQSKAIDAVKMQFSQSAAARPLPPIAVPPSGALNPSVPPLPIRGDGYTTAVYDGQLQVPGSAMFNVKGEPNAPYLVETDPAFTDRQNFVSSDYYFDRLNLDGSRLLKRYGDGFAEAQLIDDQIMGLTGRRFIGGYGDSQSQFKALMDAGVSVAEQYQLTPGAELSEAQMQQLTSDVVLLVKDTVTLADGSTTEVLVPKVYLRRPQSGDLTPQGSLVAGSDVIIRAPGQNVVNSGTLYAHGGSTGTAGTVSIEGRNVTNSGTVAGNQIGIKAEQDILNLGGRITGLGQESKPSVIALQAGRNIELRTVTQNLTYTQGSATATATLGTRVATLAGDKISLEAGQDLIAQGARVRAGDILVASAGRNIDIGAVLETRAVDVQPGTVGYKGRETYWKQSETTALGSSFEGGKAVEIKAVDKLTVTGSQIASSDGNVRLEGQSVDILAAVTDQRIDVQSVGNKRFLHTDTKAQTVTASEIRAGNNVAIIAKDDIRVAGSTVDATKGQASLIADKDISIEAVRTEHSHAVEGASKGGWALSSVKGESNSTTASKQVTGSAVGGNTVLIDAGRDVKVSASSVSSTEDLAIVAKRDITITGEQNLHTANSAYKDQRSGFFGSGGNLAVGNQRMEGQAQSTATVTERAIVGSLAGNVSINAGGTYTQKSSDVLAAGDVTIKAKDIQILADVDSTSQAQQFKSSQSAITLGMGAGGIISQGASVMQNADAAVQTDSDRAGTLRAVAAGRGLYDMSQKFKPGADGVSGSGDQQGFTGGIRLGVESSRSESSFAAHSETVQNSTITGGGKVTLQADSESGSIVSRAATVQGKEVSLSAHTIDLGAQQTQASNSSSNQSSGWTAGVTYNGGWSFDASASSSKGQAEGQSTQQANTHIRAQQGVSFTSTGDTSLRGARIEGETVTGKVGGNLTIESLQDTAVASAQQSSNSVSFGYGGSGSGSYEGTRGGIGLSSGNASGNYAGVTEQSGIAAGKGGFDVEVAGTTHLKGGLIDSLAGADKNSLTTGRLVTEDIANHSQFNSSTFGLTASYSSNANASGNLGNGLNALPDIPQFDSSNDHSSTRSAIAAGNINLTQGTQKENDQQIASLNRDVEAERNKKALDPLPDLGRTLQSQADTAMAIRVAGPALYNIVGDIAESRFSQAAVDYERAKAMGDTAGMQSARQEMDAWSEGGVGKVVLHGAAGAMLGNVPGMVSAAANQTLTPYLQQQAEAKFPYPEGASPETKKEIDRQRSDYMLLGSTVVGAITGGAAGANVTTTATQNNYLRHTEQIQRYRADAACRGGDDAGCKTRDALDQRSQQRQEEMVSNCIGGDAATCRANVAQASRDLYELHLYGIELDKQIANATDPKVAAELKGIKAQNEVQMRQAGSIIKTDLGEIEQNKGGLTAGERNVYSGLNAGSTQDGLDILFTGGAAALGQRKPAGGATRVKTAEEVKANTAAGAPERTATEGQTTNTGAGNGEAVFLGTKLGNDDATVKAAKWLKPQDGYYDVVIHGAPDTVAVRVDDGWQLIDQRSLSAYIKKQPDYNGDAIRLASCQTGACDTGFAQNLANKMGVPVMAPTDTLFVFPNGKAVIGPNQYTNSGVWKIFYPGKTN
ncbi:hemagglutinin repeat-containing protein [Ottowia thiooxydans]|uniref:two-partner secretion domain-containing protein n=1 Tax=Ottowia thiooxydans TaxID=219182 RepID=UPI0003F5F8AE|nr:hemagglutinin repeat-containing protein [Ottowia thiooxydans]